MQCLYWLNLCSNSLFALFAKPYQTKIWAINMTELQWGMLLIAALVFFVLIGIDIAIALIAIAFVGVWLIRENIELAMHLMYMSAYNGVADYIFATIPLFVLMGLLVSISNVGKDTFDVAESLLRKIKGGLGVATVAATGFRSCRAARCSVLPKTSPQRH